MTVIELTSAEQPLLFKVNSRKTLVNEVMISDLKMKSVGFHLATMWLLHEFLNV